MTEAEWKEIAREILENKANERVTELEEQRDTLVAAIEELLTMAQESARTYTEIPPLHQIEICEAVLESTKLDK